MSIVDITIGLFTFGALSRGYQMGFAHELERLLKTGLALLGSFGLFRYLRDSIQSLTGMESGLSGIIGFIASFAVIYWLVRFVRAKLRKIIDVKFGATLKPAGAILGASHAVAVALALLAGLTITNWSTTNKLILKNSKVASFAASFVDTKKSDKSTTEAAGRQLDNFKQLIKDRNYSE